MASFSIRDGSLPRHSPRHFTSGPRLLGAATKTLPDDTSKIESPDELPPEDEESESGSQKSWISNGFHYFAAVCMTASFVLAIFKETSPLPYHENYSQIDTRDWYQSPHVKEGMPHGTKNGGVFSYVRADPFVVEAVESASVMGIECIGVDEDGKEEAVSPDAMIVRLRPQYWDMNSGFLAEGGDPWEHLFNRGRWGVEVWDPEAGYKFYDKAPVEKKRWYEVLRASEGGHIIDICIVMDSPDADEQVSSFVRELKAGDVCPLVGSRRGKFRTAASKSYWRTCDPSAIHY